MSSAGSAPYSGDETRLLRAGLQRSGERLGLVRITALRYFAACKLGKACLFGVDKAASSFRTSSGDAGLSLRQVAVGERLGRTRNGIGGGVAEVVGKLLQNLGNGKHRQIFVITHLPQVAAQSVQHYKVTKEIINNETVSAIKLLDENQRIEEIARMLGGLKITEATIDHAKEILS